jgi:hypothetical protein
MHAYDDDDDDDGDDDLPARREDVSRVEELEDQLNRLDGHVSSKVVPLEANDIGDVDERANPRACDLGYPEGYECATEFDPVSEAWILSDPPNWAFADGSMMMADDEAFIEDIKEWA